MHGVGTCDPTGSPALHASLSVSTGTHALAAASRLGANRTPGSLAREQSIRETVLRIFSNRFRDESLLLSDLSKREWRRLQTWLDISGMALYLYDRLAELGRCDVLPALVADRLQQNQVDNTERTRGMIAESVTLQQEFQRSGLSYAVMKGLSLCPESVPRPELRHQFDLDYLVAEESVAEARGILERRGYRLYAVSGKSWEFKKSEMPHLSLKDFYKDQPGRAVELHVETIADGKPSRLDRVVHREICGMRMPVLSPVDLFLGQGLHAFKDVCSAFSRTAHLLEFYRHVLSRRNDDAFWRQLRSAAENDRRAALGIGIVTDLLTTVMHGFAPEVLLDWTVDVLPASMQLWVKLYGGRSIFAEHPGTKLYLLLQEQIELAGVPARRPVGTSLLPRRLPPVVIRPLPRETLATRMARHYLQLCFILARARFHLVEGLRYVRESGRWRRQVERLSS